MFDRTVRNDKAEGHFYGAGAEPDDVAEPKVPQGGKNKRK